MKGLKLALLYLTIIFFVGCKTKQTASKVSTVKSDTLIIKSKVIESPPILSSLTINDICDTITGEPIKFKKQLIIKNDTVFVEVFDNELQIKYNIAADLIKKQDSVIKIKDYQHIEEIENTRNKTPKWAWISLLLTIACFVFPIIPTFVNKLIRKLIAFI